jgi:hypothetical protein
MIDRAINIITLLIFLLALIVIGVNTYGAWIYIEPWEQGWSANENVEYKVESERLTQAIKVALDKKEYSDSYRLREILENNYTETGVIKTRINAKETVETVQYVLLVFTLLIIPLCFNYIRHGKFKIWNKNA